MNNDRNRDTITLNVNGMTRMSKKLQLQNYVDSFIREYKHNSGDGYHLDVSSVHESELEEFVSHIIEADSEAHEGWEWLFYEAYREDLANDFISYLRSYGNRRIENKDKFVEELTKSAIKAYIPRMQQLVDESIDQVYYEDDEERRNPSDPDDWDYQEGAYA